MPMDSSSYLKKFLKQQMAHFLLKFDAGEIHKIHEREKETERTLAHYVAAT
jgi:hypothetical protein